MRHRTRWTARKIAARLELIAPLQHRRRVALEPLELETAEGWRPVPPHAAWGAWRQDFRMRGRFRVPEGWGEAVLLLPLGEAGDFSHPEALVHLDGEPWAGCDRHHQEIPLGERWQDGREHALALEGWTGLGGGYFPRPGTACRMGEPAVAEVDGPTRELHALARVALEAAEALEEGHPARGRLLNALDEAFRVLDTRAPLREAFHASVPGALAALRAGVGRAGAPLDVTLHATGHAHLDLAWLWTWEQTRRKGRRTFHTVLRLMERFPAYHFSQSQPQLYHAVERDDPNLFAALRERVREGRWEPLGGMWVEADATMSGAEALARQLLLGRRYFAEAFGPEAESPVLWLPDDFGFPWSLPQLAVQAGLKYFMTIKIGWNQYNRMPYDSFWWEGIDGTRLLAHFSTAPDLQGVHASTYNAVVDPRQILGAWQAFQQKEDQEDVLMAFGHGDGGGGPTREMLENLRELSAFPGLPRTVQGPVGAFFRKMEERAAGLPVWNGELYLELHRGTFTSQARTKRHNRKSEVLLHDTEFLCSLASVADPAFAHPHAALEECWRRVCLHQFHDILPGSSVPEVYEETGRAYEEVRLRAEGLRDGALAALGGGDLLVANTTSFERREPVRLPPGFQGRRLVRPDGAAVAVEGDWLDPGPVPPYSVLRLRREAGEAPGAERTARAGRHAGGAWLENDLVRVELDLQGRLSRVFDRQAGREVLPPGGTANVLQVFEDRPLDWEAWDVDIFYDDRCWEAEAPEALEVVEEGPLRAAVGIRRRVMSSPFRQTVSLRAGSRRLDFATEVDWRERNLLLKAAFPVAVLSPVAHYEIQWGHVARPTHRNTSWDWARFECVAHRWVDLSEGDYGASLLNDCKYGHDVQGNVLRITLLRSPGEPDPTADLGLHRFTYSFLPHPGPLGEETVREGYLLNHPLLAFPGGGGPAGPPEPLVAASPPSLVVETVKAAEDGRGLVVRIYDSLRRRGPGTLRCGFDLAGAWRTDLLENDLETLDVSGREVQFPFRPFEILTLRLLPARC